MEVDLKTIHESRFVHCVYDEKEFKIKYNEAVKAILLYRSKELVHMFPTSIGFIEETKYPGGTYFAVSNLPEDKSKKRYPMSLDIFKMDSIYNDGFKGFHLRKISESLDIKTCIYKEIHLPGGSYIVCPNKSGGKIYSTFLNKVSPEYVKIFDYNETSKVNPYVVFVEQIITSQLDEVNDRIVFGIDPVNFCIGTKIYSYNQNKYIDILDMDEIKKFKSSNTLVDKYSGYIPVDNWLYDTNGRETINYMIRLPLFRKAQSFDKRGICGGSNLKPDFIRNLGEYPKES